jgi:CheY-like chemotaxis protein
MEKSKNFDEIEILLVEDNPGDAELTLRALTKNNLVNNVFVVRDGEEALEFIFCKGRYADRNISLPPKVILLDLNLPKVSGLEVIKIIKSDERTKTIPIVVVSDSHENSDLKEAYKLGVNSYILKPVVFENFVKAINDAGAYWVSVNQQAKK